MKRVWIIIICFILMGCNEVAEKQVKLSLDEVVKMSISNGNQRIDILRNTNANTIKSILDPIPDDSMMLSISSTEDTTNSEVETISTKGPLLIDTNRTEYALEEWRPLFDTLSHLNYSVVDEANSNGDEGVFYLTIELTDGNIVVEVRKDFTLLYIGETEILKTEHEDVKTLYKELSSVKFPQISTVCKKPVIYLYPEVETKIAVKLITTCELTTTYPEYNNGWEVIAYPDGELLVDDHQYAYLYWEGITKHPLSIDAGFVVAGEDTAVFLDDKLELMGLNYRERNDFITYWLPEMEDNPYNKIHFMQESYDEIAKLEITPEPQSLIRVFMLFEGIEVKEELEPQILIKATREGFTVVDWGGSELN
ncbi:MAG: hypothetical protein JEZ08_09810 [Clostridiales bacterium]|nr:hypothetical protein [Clostridiales bacterium]